MNYAQLFNTLQNLKSFHWTTHMWSQLYEIVAFIGFCGLVVAICGLIVGATSHNNTNQYCWVIGKSRD